jgi:hypothetical protein
MLLGIVVFGLVGRGDVPVAVDDVAVTNEGTAITIDVLANDTGLSDIPLTVIPLSAPAYGSITVDANNNLFYRPPGGFNGTVTVDYRVCDADVECSDATVTIHVNDTPIGLSERSFTPPGEPLAVVLRAEDADIDAQDPLEHPIQFVVLARPEHGELSGDLTAVSYPTDGVAHVKLTYTPEPGFIGVDQIVFTVTDPFGGTTTAVLDVDVGQRAALGQLTGHAGSFLTFAGPPLSVSGWEARIWSRYWIPDLGIETVMLLDETGWTNLTLIAEYAISDLLSARGTVDLLPLVGAFDSFKLVTDFQFGELDLTHTVYVPLSVSSGYHELDLRAQLCDATVRGEIRIPFEQNCHAIFDEATFSVSAPWLSCGLWIDADLAFSCPDGFESWSVTLRDIPILSLGGEVVDVFGELRTTFTPGADVGKAVQPGLRLKLPSATACVRLNAELVGPTNSWEIDGINITELEIQAGFPGAIVFVLEEDLDDGTELFSLTGPLNVCCGAPGLWRFAMTFPGGGNSLFDWNSFVADIELPIGEAIELSFSGTWTWDATWAIDLGWSVAW